MLTQKITLIWMQRLISLAVLQQTFELFMIRSSFSEQGLWRWSLLRQDFQRFPILFRQLFDFLLSTPNFTLMLWARCFVALLIWVFPHPALVVFLLLSTILISWRWRGAFNGGSDVMTATVLLGLSWSSIFPNSEVIQKGALWYIAIQVCLSYFIAGIAKFQNLGWRNGTTLRHVIVASNYDVPDLVRNYFLNSAQSKLLFVASWSVILFECTFPFGLLHPKLCFFMMAGALVFHLGNVWILGLNRFVLPWLAAYPALLFCATQIASR